MNTYKTEISAEDKEQLDKFSGWIFWITPKLVYAKHESWADCHRVTAPTVFSMYMKLKTYTWVGIG